jgi:DNA-binding NtrC family response regulator
VSPKLTTALSILLVDDEEEVLTTQDAILRSIGLNSIITCSDSRQVMDALKQHEVEVVVLDLVMPHVSGEELLAKIQHRREQAGVQAYEGDSSAVLDPDSSCLY